MSADGHLHVRAFSGSLRVFLAEALIIPSGLVVSIYLARALGPAEFGVLAVAIAVIDWVELTITATFSATVVRFVARASDWRPVGTVALRLHLLAGLAVAGALALGADGLARITGTVGAGLAAELRVFAVDVPLFALAHAHRNILAGQQRFSGRAWATASRWIMRPVFVIPLVAAGLGIRGAVIGSIGATLVELAICRAFVRPSLFGPGGRPWRAFLSYAGPTFLYIVVIRLFDRVDLLALQSLGGTAEQAGHYGAAMRLAMFPGLLVAALNPVIVAVASAAWRRGKDAAAASVVTDALRLLLAFAPFVALVAASADAIVTAVYGVEFGPAGTLLALLAFAALGRAVISLAVSALIGAGRPSFGAVVAFPMLAVTLVGLWLAVPRWGPAGAAAVALSVTCAGAAACLYGLARATGARVPARWVFRSGGLALVAGGVGAWWETAGLAVFGELAVSSLGVLAVYASSAELRRGVGTLVRELLRASPASRGSSDPPGSPEATGTVADERSGDVQPAGRSS